MSDARGYDDQSLPWLEAVENEDGPRAISARKMLVALLLVLLAGAIVAGTMFWLGRRDPAVTGAPQLIRAEPGPYKVKPTDPGRARRRRRQRDGLFDQRGRGSRRGAGRSKAPAGNGPASGGAQPAGPAQENSAGRNQGANARCGGACRCLRARRSSLAPMPRPIKAETAWKLLSGRFPEVAALQKSVVTATVGGKSIVRLRAVGSSDQTRAACAALKAAGENCLVVN